METFDIYFYYNNIRLNKNDLYKASVAGHENAGGCTYEVVVNCEELQALYGTLTLVKKDSEWEWNYAGDVDLFNLKIRISEAIEAYEAHLVLHAEDMAV